MDAPTHEFEDAAKAELEAILEIVLTRRNSLIAHGAGSLTFAGMGRSFALGAVDSAVWRLLRRAQGDFSA